MKLCAAIVAAQAALVLSLGCGGGTAPRDPSTSNASAYGSASASANVPLAESPPPSPPPPSGTWGSTWRPFEGRVVSRGDVFVLADERQRRLRVPADDVRENSDGTIDVRIGGRVIQPSTIPGEPLSTAALKSAECEQDHSSPNCSACIGLIRVCCNHGELVGTCFGLKDCP